MYDAEHYNAIYDQRLKSLTADWRARREAIKLPKSMRVKGHLNPSQTQFSTLLGFSPNAYGRQERGEVQPNRASFCKVMAMFDKFKV